MVNWSSLIMRLLKLFNNFTDSWAKTFHIFGIFFKRLYLYLRQARLVERPGLSGGKRPL